MRVLALLLIVLSSLDLRAEPRRRSVRASGWTVPNCAQVEGFPAVSVTVDGGRTVLPQSESAESIQIDTFGLAALDRPNRLLAITGRLLLHSNDAGCKWEIVENVRFPQSLTRLARAGADRAWAWSILGPELFRIGTSIEERRVEERRMPVELPIAFHANEDRLATADDHGDIWWSDDGGVTWSWHATAASRPMLFALEFSPRDREHVISAGIADGAYVTFDGGATWTASRGLEGQNVFRVAFSPVHPGVVWAIALDPKVIGVTKRAIYRSTDGGLSFARVITASNDVQMTNGFVLAPHPRDPSLLYFATYGTKLYLVDAEGAIRMQSDLPHRNVDALVFSPATPDVMYLGLKLSDMSATSE